MLNTDVEFHIRHNYTWLKLPGNIKQAIGNSQKEYDKSVVTYSIKNQLRYKSNLIRWIRKDEKKYYEELLSFSREHLMLYPYHLSDVIVKGLRITPFNYYSSMLQDIMSNEKSYDSLPNFTAADCLRLLGIGRNQYIDLMNQCRSSRKFFRRRPVKELLPPKPIPINIDGWWTVHVGFITEDDVKMCSLEEKLCIDHIIDNSKIVVAELDTNTVQKLYNRGLIYIDVSIQDDDCFIVPPLEGFVMNRVTGDYFETLLYKIFVSIDEHTTISELASVLEIDLTLVKNAVSVYCRLGFSQRKNRESDADRMLDAGGSFVDRRSMYETPLDEEWAESVIDNEACEPQRYPSTSDLLRAASMDDLDIQSSGHQKRIAFLFDSTLTAFLMMGNLSQGLKSHAVTMFEVGKLCDESLDSFIAELDKVDTGREHEGEAQRYFDHAITLRNTIQFLRYNKDLVPDPDQYPSGLAVDLVRCESLHGLDAATCSRVLNKNYRFLVSMAPLSNEIKPISSCTPQHFGPAIPEINSIWFKLYIYSLIGEGPPSLLLVKGTKLRRLPKIFHEYERLLITSWGHDPGIVASSNILITLNDALMHSAVLIQPHGWASDGTTIHVPFPLEPSNTQDPVFTWSTPEYHPAVRRLATKLNLQHVCGFITLLRTGRPSDSDSGFIEAEETSDSRTSPTADNTDLSDVASSPVEPSSSLDSANPPLATHPEPDFEIVNENEFKKMDQLATSDVSDDVMTTDSKSTNQSATPDDAMNINEHRPPFSLDIGTTRSHDGVLEESDWTLLEVFYGLPLFDMRLNVEVCSRIAMEELCRHDNLERVLNVSRSLSLRVLNFISQHLDKPVVPESGLQLRLKQQWSHNTQSPVPLPTHNLLFTDGLLTSWSDR